MRLKRLDEIEREAVLATLKFFKGNVRYTSKALGVSVGTIKNKIKDYRSMGYEVHPNIESQKESLNEYYKAVKQLQDKKISEDSQ